MNLWPVVLWALRQLRMGVDVGKVGVIGPSFIVWGDHHIYVDSDFDMPLLDGSCPAPKLNCVALARRRHGEWQLPAS